jgi:hypothetical protein
MITESELREAMQHSAARADQLIERRQSATSRPDLIDRRFRIDRAPAGRRRIVVAAAVAVAVVSGSAPALARLMHHSAAAPQRNGAAGGPANPKDPARHTEVAVTNLATITGDSGYRLGVGMETISPPAGGIHVMALPATRFDPTRRLTDPQPVSVGGAHGYAGRALIYLVDRDDPQQASKAGAPRNTVAWPTGDGIWLVAQSGMADGPGFADVAVGTLVHDAQHLGVRAAPAALRSGYRARWLPPGLALTGVTGSVGDPAIALTLTSGDKSIIIQASSSAGRRIPTSGLASATKRVAGYSVTVTGTGYDHATVQRVLDGLDLSRLAGPQSGWWTLDRAVNG